VTNLDTSILGVAFKFTGVGKVLEGIDQKWNSVKDKILEDQILSNTETVKVLGKKHAENDGQKNGVSGKGETEISKNQQQNENDKNQCDAGDNEMENRKNSQNVDLASSESEESHFTNSVHLGTLGGEKLELDVYNTQAEVADIVQSLTKTT